MTGYCLKQLKKKYSVKMDESEADQEPTKWPAIEFLHHTPSKSENGESEELEEDSIEEFNESSTKEHSKSVFHSLSYRNSDETQQAIEDPSIEYVSQPSSESDTDGTDDQSEYQHNCSNEKKRPPGETAFGLAPIQVFPSQKKCRREESCEPESDIESTIADLDSKSIVSQEILSDENQEDDGSSGKRRHGETDEGDKTSKRRKIRWDSDDLKLKMLGPIHLPDFAKDFVGSKFDTEIHELKLRLNEIKSKLQSSEHHDERPEEERSPSPQPVYNNLGIRINTREARLREKLLEEHQHIILNMIKKNPTFRTPPKYKPPKLFKKLYVPVKEYPTCNFIGLIIGPRGNTQKRMEKKSGAKILLRGKGSMKTPQKQDTSSDEDLHVYIEADKQESLNAAVMMVEKLLIPVDTGVNGHKRAQLEELAKLKGTYIYENMYSVCRVKKKSMKVCAICGSLCHCSSNCPLTASPQVINTLCGSSSSTKSKANKEISDAKLYVGYLPSNVDELGLRELFSPFGKIVEAKVTRDPTTSSRRGYGFVKFKNSTDAAVAVAHMNGFKLDGKLLAVRVAGRPKVSIAVPSQTTWLGPPRLTRPESQPSSPRSEGIGLPSSSIRSGHCNQLPGIEAIAISRSASQVPL